MTEKIKLVITQESFLSNWISSLLEQEFSIEFYNHNNTYTKNDLYFYTNSISPLTTQILNIWPGRIVYDELFEANPFDSKCYIDDNNTFHLTARDFIWWHFSHTWVEQGYQNNFAKLGGDKFFLLLMNLRRPHRDWLYKITEEKYHDHALYSYFHKNKIIKGDVERVFETGPWQGYCNMDWYNNTCFSLVAESKGRGKTFVSEKIYKPLAYGHSFIACGTKGMLKLLKLQGFETFSPYINETYDSVDDLERYNKIEQELDKLYDLFKQNALFCDKQLTDILKHNHHHFFNIAHVDNLMKTQMLEPLLEYYHTI
jgi:hypothetical protein